ncbi:hypothetical protein Mycsm_05259 [Mycobacterium sp. JS623]|nr:hypothetical protein Mycsm_05259 [Mycobacterium sp. JS623]
MTCDFALSAENARHPFGVSRRHGCATRKRPCCLVVATQSAQRILCHPLVRLPANSHCGVAESTQRSPTRCRGDASPLCSSCQR